MTPTLHPHHPVFISYARSESRAEVERLQQELARIDIGAFVDSSDVDVDEQFPEAITSAILNSRIVVAFVSPTYFARWYCIREWQIALAPFEAAVAQSADATTCAMLVEHILLALSSRGFEHIEPELPPLLRNRNALTAADAVGLAKAIEQRLRATKYTVGELANAHRASASALNALRSREALPPANLRGLTIAPLNLPASLDQDFIGRANLLWSLRHTLSTTRGDQSKLAATCALSGVAGCGKTRLAREYLHRFAPWYPGGLFYIDARLPNQRLRCLHEVLRALRLRRSQPIDDYDEYQRIESRDPGILARHIAEAIHLVPASEHILWVIDNFPEHQPPQLSEWCPALGRVTTLITTRAQFVNGVPTSNHLALHVLSITEARRLLRRGVTEGCHDDDVDVITEWVGRLPLALEILNAALRMRTTKWRSLLDHVADELTALTVADAHFELLRNQLDKDALRGVAAAFELTLQHLGPASIRAAEQLAFISPAPITSDIVDRICMEAGDEARARSELANSSLITVLSEAPSSLPRSRWEMHTLLAEYLIGRQQHSCSMDPTTSQFHVPIHFPELIRTIASYIPEQDIDPTAELTPLLARLTNRISRYFISDNDLRRILILDTSVRSAAIRWGSVDLARIALDLLLRLPANANIKLTIRLAQTSHLIGELSNDAQPLITAIGTLELALQTQFETPRTEAWAVTQSNLGLCRATLGRITGSQTQLQDAVGAHRAALLFYTESNYPIHWAHTHVNMANAIAELHAMNGDPQLRQDVISAYQASLSIFTETDHPTYWATTHNNIGNALSKMGHHLGDRELLSRAIDAYRSALRVITESQQPAKWSMICTNLGNTLRLVAELTDDAHCFRESINTIESALRVRSEHAQPARWALTKTILGLVLKSLGTRTDDAHLLQTSITTFEDTLRVYTQDDQPALWASTQLRLGDALYELGYLTNNPHLLNNAIAAFEAALQVFSEDGQSADWAHAQGSLGNARATLGKLTGSVPLLRSAIVAYEAALRFYTDTHHRSQWALTQSRLGTALSALGELTGSEHFLRDAIRAFEAALRIYTEADDPGKWADTQSNLGNALAKIGFVFNRDHFIHRAVVAYEAGLRAYTFLGATNRAAQLRAIMDACQSHLTRQSPSGNPPAQH